AEPYRAERPRSVGWAIAACVAARSDVLRRLGPFDPAQFLFFEDMDLCLRARAAGIPTVLDPSVGVRHLGGHATRPAYAGEPRGHNDARVHPAPARLGPRGLPRDGPREPRATPAVGVSARAPGPVRRPALALLARRLRLLRCHR